MSLILCPECHHKISDQASSCPSCGFPLLPDEKPHPDGTVNKPNDVGKSVTCPDFPSDMDNGVHVPSSVGRNHIKGYYNHGDNIVSLGESCSAWVYLRSKGIEIASNYETKLNLHKAQIISLSYSNRNDISGNDSDVRSQVLKNAIVGGALLGPAGAVVGGLLGASSKHKVAQKQGDGYLVINYWDVNTKTVQTLLISGQSEEIIEFVKVYQDEVASGNTENIKQMSGSEAAGCLLIFLAIGVIGGYILSRVW